MLEGGTGGIFHHSPETEAKSHLEESERLERDYTIGGVVITGAMVLALVADILFTGGSGTMTVLALAAKYKGAATITAAVLAFAGFAYRMGLKSRRNRLAQAEQRLDRARGR